MAANKLDPKALARLAIWARFGAPIPRRQKWRGFDSRESSRLIELASAVDRKTLLRFLGIHILLLLCCSLIFAALMGAAIVLSHASSLSFTSLTLLTVGDGFVVTIAVLLAYLVALEAGPPRSLIEFLTVQAGDAELVAKFRRKTFWATGASVVAIVLLLFTLLMFRETLCA
jgi:hypothetical protein